MFSGGGPLALGSPSRRAFPGDQGSRPDFHDRGTKPERTQLVKERFADAVSLAEPLDAIRIVSVDVVIRRRAASAVLPLVVATISGGVRRTSELTARAGLDHGVGRAVLLAHGNGPLYGAIASHKARKPLA
jgi:hypothetical protein